MTQSTTWSTPRPPGRRTSATTSVIVPTCRGCGAPPWASCTCTWWVCWPIVVMLRVLSSSSRLRGDEQGKGTRGGDRRLSLASRHRHLAPQALASDSEQDAFRAQGEY